jgi:hypothetical protein
MPGDKVTVTIFLYEGGTDTINLLNITINYPWYSILLGGNQTIIVPSAQAGIAQGKNWNFTASFTIPTDGRAASGSLGISYYYRVGSLLYHDTAFFVPQSLYLHINSVPTYASVQNLDQLTTLLTVQTVLLIVSALIIAAAIFLSARRPKVTWTAEQKE